MGCCSSVPPASECTEYRSGMEGYFHCSGRCGQAGSVWGSGPYTADSCICLAARHAGAIGANGGTFRVSAAAGLEMYVSSTAHDITTSSYGTYGASVVISKG
jgi:hypothetical protein